MSKFHPSRFARVRATQVTGGELWPGARLLAQLLAAASGPVARPTPSAQHASAQAPAKALGTTFGPDTRESRDAVSGVWCSCRGARVRCASAVSTRESHALESLRKRTARRLLISSPAAHLLRCHMAMHIFASVGGGTRRGAGAARTRGSAARR